MSACTPAMLARTTASAAVQQRAFRREQGGRRSAVLLQPARSQTGSVSGQARRRRRQGGRPTAAQEAASGDVPVGRQAGRRRLHLHLPYPRVHAPVPLCLRTGGCADRVWPIMNLLPRQPGSPAHHLPLPPHAQSHHHPLTRGLALALHCAFGTLVGRRIGKRCGVHLPGLLVVAVEAEAGEDECALRYRPGEVVPESVGQRHRVYVPQPARETKAVQNNRMTARSIQSAAQLRCRAAACGHTRCQCHLARFRVPLQAWAFDD